MTDRKEADRLRARDDGAQAFDESEALILATRAACGSGQANAAQLGTLLDLATQRISAARTAFETLSGRG